MGKSILKIIVLLGLLVLVVKIKDAFNDKADELSIEEETPHKTVGKHRSFKKKTTREHDIKPLARTIPHERKIKERPIEQNSRPNEEPLEEPLNNQQGLLSSPELENWLSELTLIKSQWNSELSEYFAEEMGKDKDFINIFNQIVSDSHDDFTQIIESFHQAGGPRANMQKLPPQYEIELKTIKNNYEKQMLDLFAPGEFEEFNLAIQELKSHVEATEPHAEVQVQP